MYTLNPSEDNRLDYIETLTAQKALIVQRSKPQRPISPPLNSTLTPQTPFFHSQSSPQLANNYENEDIGLDLSFSSDYV